MHSLPISPQVNNQTETLSIETCDVIEQVRRLTNTLRQEFENADATLARLTGWRSVPELVAFARDPRYPAFAPTCRCAADGGFVHADIWDRLMQLLGEDRPAGRVAA